MPPSHRTRGWAIAALACLAGLAVAVGSLVLLAGTTLVALAAGFAVFVLLAATSSWLALTTRKRWKQGIGMGGVAALLASLAAALVALSLWQIGWVVVIGALWLLYAAAARRALAAAAPTPGAAPPGPVAAPQRPWLLVNPRSGGGTAGRVGLVDAARDRGIEVHVLEAGDDPVLLARAAVGEGADAIGVAGGDGSLGLIASVAIELDMPFVCIPAGTRNHFALDLGLDRSNPLGALDAFSGVERRIDAAAVGDRLFLNNVSLGAYASIVAEPGYRERKLTTARVVVRGLARGERPPLEVTFADPDGRRFDHAQVLQVANNRYDVRNPAKLGSRHRLDRGVLQVTTLQARTGAELARVAGHTALGRTSAQGWAQWETISFQVDSPLPAVPAGLDGESVTLTPPLQFRVLPGALRAMVPTGGRNDRLRPLSRTAVRRLWAELRAPAAERSSGRRRQHRNMPAAGERDVSRRRGGGEPRRR